LISRSARGYAQCAFAAPAVFTIHGDEALLYDPNPDGTQHERLLRAAAACPVQAIVLEGFGSLHVWRAKVATP
jgi:ferredoxin